jgi:preprotein translocase subunit Sec63
MATATSDSADIQALIGAYGLFDVELSASASAIRARYRELALRYHPDTHPHGSSSQQQAAARMAAINAAYALIRNAPLRDYRPERNQTGAPIPAGGGVVLDRPISVVTETLVRLCLGVLFGLGIALVLRDRRVPGFEVYVWILPLVIGFACTSTSGRTLNMLRILYWWG